MADLTSTPAGDITCIASSSSSSNTHLYEVFLNYRAADQKDRLASHIYRSLSVRGLNVCLDPRELEKGEDILSQIKEAIRTASVHVAIFSPNYAQSRICLEELALMVESGSAIIPVFIDVDPSELRCMRSGDAPYARDLQMHEKKRTLDDKPRYDSTTVEKWRNALSLVSNISGFVMDAYNGDEGLLVDAVVEEVWRKIRKTPLYVAKYPTGLDEKLEHLERMVLLQHQTQKSTVVGIVGLGGVGKSTLAREFFHKHRSNYHRYCFLSDVRETAAKNSLSSLQKTLLRDLAHLNHEQINNTDEGIEKLRKHLSSSPSSLIVLDDVDHIDQLDALLSPVKDNIKSSCLILVTSRNRDLLTSSGIVEASIYKQTGLNRQHSRQLFCSHAFDQTFPNKGFEQLVEDFLGVCDGLPLSLKVIGALIRGKDLGYWKAQYHKIHRIVPTDIQSKLKTSYDGLDKEEQEIFLDIACFFIGESRDTAIRIWNESGWAGWLGLRNLENRYLVEVDGEGCITMHDHLRDLGRDLAMKEHSGCQLRLSRPTADLRNLSGLSPVRGINMNYGNGDLKIWDPSRLQLLRGEGSFVESVFSAGELPQLIYLRWEECPISSISFTNRTRNLRVLSIEGHKLKTLWQHESQAPLQLRELYIDAPLSEVPDSIGKLIRLEKIVLKNSVFKALPNVFHQMHCLKNISLKSCREMMLLPDSVGILTALQTLELLGCSGLQRLPDSVGQLTGLQSINLEGCFRLQGLPDLLGQLTGLQSINLEGCSSLQGLPDSIGNLANLQNIDLKWCSSLQRLPDSVGNVRNLQSIDLRGCSGLHMLPNSFRNLKKLRHVDLSECSNLEMLPYSFGNLRNLQYINLSECSKLRWLPDTVGQLKGLLSLNLEGCSSLQGLSDSVGQLTGLQSINLERCFTLQALPDWVGQLTSLQSINLEGWSSLQGLPDWAGQLMGLQSINLAGCSSLQELPDSVGQLTGLRSLHLEGCSSLQWLPESVGQLTGLQSINLEGCSSLQRLPESVGQLTGLRSLHLERCSSLQGLPESVGQVTGLQSINLERCSSLQRLPDSVGQVTGLRSLHLEGCSSLQRLSDSFGDLANLQNIDLNWCSSLQRLPDSVGNVRNLQRIDLRGCSGLHMLPNSFSNLKKLRHVDLSKCSNLEMLPYSFGNLRNLQYINLSECSNLQMLPSSLENLKHLQHMDLSWCSNLQTLPNSLGNLRNIRQIDLSWCSNLQMLPISFGNLTNLQHINLSGCSNLPILPNSFGNLIQLKHLCLKKCYELTISSETLGQIRTLEWLEISGCYGIEVLPPQITNQRFLREMYLFCPFLKELPSTIGELSHLEILHLESSCLELLEMGELVSLEELQVSECVNLKSIQGLAQLTKLRKLDVANCSGLEELSGVEHLRSLEKLNASGCPNLQWGRGVLEQLDKQLKGCIIK